MIGQIGSFEDIGEKGQSAVRSSAKSTKQSAQNFAKAAATQITGSQSGAPQNDQGTNEASSTAAQQQMSDDDAQKFLQDLYGVKKPTQNSNAHGSQNSASQGVPLQGQKPQQNQQTVKAALGLTNAGKSQEKTPTPKETIKAALGIPESKPAGPVPKATETIKNALGIPEIGSNQKTPEEQAKILALRSQLHGEYYQKLTKPTQASEENVTEKLEREDEEKKMADLETDKEKPPPLPATVKQGTGENVVGVSG